MTRRGGIVLINVLALALIPYLLELVLYIADPGRRLPVNGVAGGSRFTWGHEVRQNSWSFREREFSVTRSNRTFRIMVLGDSLTWGAGLAVTSRYTDLLQRNLEELRPDIAWEVLNFGVDGFDTKLEAETLKDFGALVAPDLVVVGFCFNDATMNSQEYSVERENFTRHFPALQQVEPVFNSMGFPLLGTKLKTTAYGWAEVSGIIPEWPESMDRSYRKDSADWMNFTTALATISSNAVTVTTRRPVFIALNQVMDKTSREKIHQGLYIRLFRWYEQALIAAVDAGFVAADCADLLPGDQPLEWYVVNEADNHPSGEMNRIYAERLCQMIIMDPDMAGVLSADATGEKP